MYPLPEKCVHYAHKRHFREPLNVLENLSMFPKFVNFAILNTSELFSPWGLSSKNLELYPLDHMYQHG